MPAFMQGNMWSVFDTVNYFVITTNSMLKNNGAVVMGRGIAKQARDRFPGLDVEIGQAIKARCGSGGAYGLILGHKIGVFQVKRHWADEADLELIALSAGQLADEAIAHPDLTFALNFPGIGNGKLAYSDVKPLLDVLPDNVQVWTFN